MDRHVRWAAACKSADPAGQLCTSAADQARHSVSATCLTGSEVAAHRPARTANMHQCNSERTSDNFWHYMCQMVNVADGIAVVKTLACQLGRCSPLPPESIGNACGVLAYACCCTMSWYQGYMGTAFQILCSNRFGRQRLCPFRARVQKLLCRLPVMVMMSSKTLRHADLPTDCDKSSRPCCRSCQASDSSWPGMVLSGHGCLLFRCPVKPVCFNSQAKVFQAEPLAGQRQRQSSAHFDQTQVWAMVAIAACF